MGLFGNKADPTKSAVLKAAIGALVDPHSGESLATAQAVERAEVRGDRAEVDIVLDYPAAGWESELTTLIEQVARTVEGVRNTKVTVAFVSPLGSQQQGKAMPGVRNIIAVASGKGGVGKSTTSVNLALALTAEGARVGLLDADIYGPSQPKMLGAREQPQVQEDRSMKPVMAHGLQTMSIGYLVEDDTAVIWRGPMVTSALMQLLNDTRWDQLDYLVIDMPPGTGDIQLTLAQQAPVSVAVIVTTPQDLALLDARKGIEMFQKVNIPTLGIVENMSVHRCPQCGYESHPFGTGGGAGIAEQYGVPVLAELPLSLAIREQADAGRPTVVAEPHGEAAARYLEGARHMAARLWALGQEPAVAISMSDD